jgi:hypothetical protein
VADYFVSPQGDSDLRLESSTIAEALREQWPDVRFIEHDDAANSLRWAVPMSVGREVSGELQSGGQVVALEGDLHDAAEFARWIRRQIPQRYALIFWDQAYTNDVPLTLSTSPEELAEPFALRN